MPAAELPSLARHAGVGARQSAGGCRRRRFRASLDGIGKPCPVATHPGPEDPTMPDRAPAEFRTLALAWVVALAAGAGVANPAGAAGPTARWVGQDGKDFVGAEPGPAPNGYQDVHVALVGLPSGRMLTFVELKGHGHGAWNNQVGNKAAVHVARGNRPGTFDLYLEPYQRETGREFELKWKLDDGQSGGLYFPGGKADPSLRAGGAGIEVRWVAPGGGGAAADRTGPGVGVGPDGVPDAQLALSKLPPQAEVREVALTLPGAKEPTWRSGANPQGALSAEFVRHEDDPARGDLFFSPTPELAGPKNLQVAVTYADGRGDFVPVAVGRLPAAKAAAPAAVANLAESPARARWIGQGQGQGAERGEVRVEVEGLAPGRAIVAAALSDGVLAAWRWRRDDSVRFDAGPDPRRLRADRPAPGRLVLAFPPIRDEAGATMTLRLRDASGREEVARFPGGPVDLARLAPPLPPGTAQARPGDDLHALAARAGTVTLAPGVYNLARPLVLDRPTRLVGPGATLRFAPGPNANWTAAIKVHAGGTTLEGFAVRFAGPVAWHRDVEHGPAVIASTDNRDDRPRDDEHLRHGVNLVGLDLEAPPAATEWEEAAQLVRFRSIGSGRVERCKLKGGTVHLGGGPWTVVDNEYLGTRPNTYSHGVFALLYPHDLTLARNRAHDIGPSGKTWRFLVLAQRGANDRVVDNVVDGGIGPRQDDPHPHQNAPELILTEAYRLHYEGKPAGISPDGRVLAIHAPQGHPAATGDAVAILAGSQAGQWRTIAQPLGPRMYLLDEPIAADAQAVSVATGFVREAFERNTVDCRGSTIAAPLVLAGNVFGVRVVGNRFLGGGEAVRLHAAPSESPVHWGWSHAPFLGGTFADNLVEDAAGGASFGFGVEHGPPIKANRGRTYMTLDLRDNTFRWTPAGKPCRVNLGYAPTLDPAELVITERGTRVEGAPPAIAWVAGARINGAEVRDAPLPGR